MDFWRAKNQISVGSFKLSMLSVRQMNLLSWYSNHVCRVFVWFLILFKTIDYQVERNPLKSPNLWFCNNSQPTSSWLVKPRPNGFVKDVTLPKSDHYAEMGVKVQSTVSEWMRHLHNNYARSWRNDSTNLCQSSRKSLPYVTHNTTRPC